MSAQRSDLRRISIAAAQDVLRQKPTGGAVFAFRGRRGDRLKLLHWDG
ncbi:IS66 family insertion sequence element accessory protein TnpB, partial [Paracoccus denitrificans]